MRGLWILVCGPSGAGKDSVLAWAQERLALLPRIVFARRMVTRPSGPHGEHDEVSAQQMEALRQAGGLAWHWQAHGHGYGIAAAYAQQVRDGAIVVVNGSRAHAADVGARADVRRVLLTAPPALVEARLRARGREADAAVALRLARNASLSVPDADHVIPNEGTLAEAGQRLCDYLQELAR